MHYLHKSLPSPAIPARAELRHQRPRTRDLARRAYAGSATPRRARRTDRVSGTDATTPAARTPAM
jgi:hypothetical protein